MEGLRYIKESLGTRLKIRSQAFFSNDYNVTSIADYSRLYISFPMDLRHRETLSDNTRTMVFVMEELGNLLEFF